jgi:hypothetical protein
MMVDVNACRYCDQYGWGPAIDLPFRPGHERESDGLPAPHPPDSHPR